MNTIAAIRFLFMLALVAGVAAPAGADVPPTATTNPATIVSASGATLNGTVNASGSSTTVTFEYGLEISYGTTVTADQSPVVGSLDTAVSATLVDLQPGTPYHYRVVATNSFGVVHGADMTFVTLLPQAACCHPSGTCWGVTDGPGAMRSGESTRAMTRSARQSTARSCRVPVV